MNHKVISILVLFAFVASPLWAMKFIKKNKVAVLIKNQNKKMRFYSSFKKDHGNEYFNTLKKKYLLEEWIFNDVDGSTLSKGADFIEEYVEDVYKQSNDNEKEKIFKVIKSCSFVARKEIGDAMGEKNAGIVSIGLGIAFFFVPLLDYHLSGGCAMLGTCFLVLGSSTHIGATAKVSSFEKFIKAEEKLRIFQEEKKKLSK